MRFTIKGINEQMRKVENYHKVYVLEDGTLFIQDSATIPQSVYDDPLSVCDVTDIYNDWVSGFDGKRNVARQIKEAAEEFYN